MLLIPQHTCVFGDILQQQRVLGQPLHLDGDDVFELQPAALGLALRLLDNTATVAEPSPPCTSTRVCRSLWYQYEGVMVPV